MAKASIKIRKMEIALKEKDARLEIYKKNNALSEAKVFQLQDKL